MTAPIVPVVPVDVDHIVTASKRAAYRPANRFVAAVLWPLWPLLDQHTGRPSGPKCMAWALYAANVAGHPVAATLAALLLATMFGYSMFKDTIAKTSLNLTSNDSVAVTLKKEVSERIARVFRGRDSQLGIDPSRPEPDPTHVEAQ